MMATFQAMKRVWVKWKWIEKLTRLRRLKGVSMAYKWCEDPEGNGINDPSGKASSLDRFCEEIELARTLARDIDDPELYEAAMKDIRALASYPLNFLEEKEHGDAEVTGLWDNHATSDSITKETTEAAREVNRTNLHELDLEGLYKVKREIGDGRHELRMAERNVDALIAKRRVDRDGRVEDAVRFDGPLPVGETRRRA